MILMIFILITTGEAADETASSQHNENGNGDRTDNEAAAMVQPSPSASDNSSSSTAMPPGSIFDTPKTPAAQKNMKRKAERASGNVDFDIDTKRMTRSNAKPVDGGDMAAGLFIHSFIQLRI